MVDGKYEGKLKTGEAKLAPSQQVQVYRLRLQLRADAIVKRVKERQGFATYAATVSWIIEQFDTVENWREKRKQEYRRNLEEDGIRVGEL